MRAILIANVATFAIAALALAFGLVFTVFIAIAAPLFGGDVLGGDLHAEATFAAAFVTVIMAISAPLGAGYIGARIAGDRYLFNGMLGTIAWTLLSILPLHLYSGSEGSTPVLPEIVGILLTYGGPLFGMLGGYLAQMRILQLAGIPAGQRTTTSLREGLVAIVLWTLAFPSACMAYTVSLKLLLMIGVSGLSFVLAVAGAVLVATAVAPDKQRTLAGYIFIGLAIAIPAEEFVRHGLLGDLANTHANRMIFNALGAGMAYLTLLWAFPRDFRPVSGKWWWLSTANLTSWTMVERRVRMGLMLTATIVCIFLYLIGVAVFRWVDLDVHLTTPAVIILAVLLGMRTARPIYSKLDPQQMRQADENAIARLGLSK